MFRLEKVPHDSESSGEDEACLYGCVFNSFGGLLLRCGLGELRENMFQMLSVILLRFGECSELFSKNNKEHFIGNVSIFILISNVAMLDVVEMSNIKLKLDRESVDVVDCAAMFEGNFDNLVA